METLAKKLRGQFDSSSVSRGEGYFHDGNVGELKVSDKSVRATVQGNDANYQVEITRKRNAFGLHCSCPYFSQGFNCKHLWALIRTADAEDVLGQWPIDHIADAKSSIAHPSSETKWRGNSLPKDKNWKLLLEGVLVSEKNAETPRRKRQREALYFIDSMRTEFEEVLTINLGYRDLRSDGELGQAKPLTLTPEIISLFPDPLDQEILEALRSSTYSNGSTYGYPSGYNKPHVVRLVGGLAKWLVPKLAATQRFFFQDADNQDLLESPIVFSSSRPKLVVKVERENKYYLLQGALVSDGKEFDLKTARFITRDGFILFGQCLFKLADESSVRWATIPFENRSQKIPLSDAEELIEVLHSLPGAPEFELPLELTPTILSPAPQPVLQLEVFDVTKGEVPFELVFLYEGQEISASDPSEKFFLKEKRAVVIRNKAKELEWHTRLLSLPFVREGFSAALRTDSLLLEAATLSQSVASLIAEGYQVRAQKNPLRAASHFELSISSGVDWFDLKADIQFGSSTVSMPDLMIALQNKQRFIRLGDGSTGILPEAWLEKYAPLAVLGEVKDGFIRFKQSQAFLLDAWLAEKGEINLPPALVAFREMLPALTEPKAVNPPEAFIGKLRPYQESGLGWLTSLDEMRLGGILADDMGLGKTVQVLAFLQERVIRHAGRPSIVVAPKSLIFNWLDEARRFTPKLKVLAYTGGGRVDLLKVAGEYDLVLTTYHTLRLDIERLKEVDFDCAILDEAQMIKNADALSSKACRLISARFRLAMTGTPIENSISDLFSILNFVLPGVLGAGIQKMAKGRGVANEISPETLSLLSRATRPFILRRTKEMVLQDLPEKVEQTLFVDLPKKEMQEYQELRDFYRLKLSKQIDSAGFAKSKIHVLEALLRLRQLACHPGLIDKTRRDEVSSKMQVIIAQLKEITAEGHKALVFSQFTQLLGILREHLERENVSIEYLDGKTRDRKERVAAFQESSEAKVFLISLKAGGLGLNLTAADYVFILDPWWNPAVEYQAIDRSHRIGQKKKVFAYRLISKGTVEEKVLELQKSKKDLAEAIISGSTGVLKALTSEDLAVLLG